MPNIVFEHLKEHINLISLRWLETVLFGARRLGSNLSLRLKKGTNKNGVAFSSGFHILRRSFKSCVKARLTYLVLSGRTENDWNIGHNSLESCPLQCYQRDRQLSRIWSAKAYIQRLCNWTVLERMETLSSTVKSYKGPRLVAFLPSFLHWLFWPRKPFLRTGRRKKVWHRSVPGQIFLELRFAFLRKHSI